MRLKPSREWFTSPSQLASKKSRTKFKENSKSKPHKKSKIKSTPRNCAEHGASRRRITTQGVDSGHSIKHCTRGRSCETLRGVTSASGPRCATGKKGPPWHGNFRPARHTRNRRPQKTTAKICNVPALSEAVAMAQGPAWTHPGLHMLNIASSTIQKMVGNFGRYAAGRRAAELSRIAELMRKVIQLSITTPRLARRCDSSKSLSPVINEPLCPHSKREEMENTTKDLARPEHRCVKKKR